MENVYTADVIQDATKKPASRVLRIGIVEDEPMTALLLRRSLEAAGHMVVGEAIDGVSGIQMVRDTQPDLVLMDSEMPGMDGIEATQRITAEYSIPIIMLTGYNEEEHINQALEAGACSYLVKPVNSARLLSAVRTALDIFKTMP
jgi:response regulator NasT